MFKNEAVSLHQMINDWRYHPPPILLSVDEVEGGHLSVIGLGKIGDNFARVIINMGISVTSLLLLTSIKVCVHFLEKSQYPIKNGRNLSGNSQKSERVIY